MKRYFTMFFLLINALNIPTSSIFSVTVAGSGEVKKGTFDDLKVNGKAELLEVKVVKNATIHGRCNAEQVTIGGDLSINGAANIEHATISGNATINGRCDAEHLDVAGTFHVNGACDISQSTIGNDAIFSGKLTAEEVIYRGNVKVAGKGLCERCSVAGACTVAGSTQFDDCALHAIEAATESLELDNTQSDAITITESKSYSFFSWLFSWLIKPEFTQQHLYLRGKSMVNGSITFLTKKPGVVHKGAHVTIAGCVTGAIVVED